MTENERETALIYSKLQTAEHEIEHAGTLDNWHSQTIRNAFESIRKAAMEFEQKIDDLTDWKFDFKND